MVEVEVFVPLDECLVPACGGSAHAHADDVFVDVGDFEVVDVEASEEPVGVGRDFVFFVVVACCLEDLSAYVDGGVEWEPAAAEVFFSGRCRFASRVR